MIVICQNCTTRLQLDDAKVPAGPFSVRCPRCQQIVQAQPRAGNAQRDAISAVADIPASARARHEGGAASRPTALVAEASRDDARAGDDPISVLAALLRKGLCEDFPAVSSPQAADWERRRVLVCVGPERREEVVAALTANQYVVFIEETGARAAERMREDRVDAVVLDAGFDAEARGAASVTLALNSLRMAERRRVVFALISETARTGDAHAAFLENANLIVNAADVGGLPLALEKNVRELNDLYNHFNKALNVPAL